MSNKKILLTSGCSFTEYPKCWPYKLKNILNVDLLNTAQQSIGNGLISRKVIYNTIELLKKYQPDEILVGIMWSAIDRHERYLENGRYDEFIGEPRIFGNPTHVVEDMNNWRIINKEWASTSKDCKEYYSIFHNSTSSLLYTFEHIFRTQLFLEKMKVDYFMMSFMDIFNVFSDGSKISDNPEVSYLRNMVDFTKFVPVLGMFEWVEQNYEEKSFDFFPNHKNIDCHPNEFGHIKFTEEIIVPYLKNKGILKGIN